MSERVCIVGGTGALGFGLAARLGREGIPVVIGGFHVSGCISMLREIPPDLQQALDLGISLFAGEAEGRMAELLHDVDRGTLSSGVL